MAASKWVYAFEEGDGRDKMLLGGKGANLCEMTRIGLNVPPGFVITTEACPEYLADGEHRLPAGAMEQVGEHMTRLEQATGKRFGGAEDPLLVSMRSGSAMSMPGMMDTILNLGLNEATLAGLIRHTANERFGHDAYRRFIQLFGNVALGVPNALFDEAFEAVKAQVGAKVYIALDAAALREISRTFLEVVRRHTGRPFLEDPLERLEIAIKAVFTSRMGKRAVDYRREFHITPAMANGTAVNVVTMVFGNMGNDSATGVGFTRNPGKGENALFGEYLVNAQGEDMVAGIRTPKPLAEMQRDMPAMHAELLELRDRLETHYREVQDFEFTIERGMLYCLQTRDGKMNAASRVRSSMEMHGEGLLTRDEALARIDPSQLEQMLFRRLDPGYWGTPLATGLPASPGAASAQAAFDADRAEQLGRRGAKVILVREETKPEDIHGFFASQGILTSRGGKTSHAAVVARGMGKPCVAFTGEQVIKGGDVITIDGGSGEVYRGEVPMVEADFSPSLRTLREVNPMLGHRGVRLGITCPEIYRMKIRAVLEAAAECIRDGMEVDPEIIVPQVCTVQELKLVRFYLDEIRREVESAAGIEVPCRFGTMIEVVRACLRAESLAECAEFFSFGTNDVTLAVFSYSREDAENKFLPMYNERGILQDNPFDVLDTKGAGRLMALAAQGPEGRHLRRARRSSSLDPVLRRHWARLRFLLGAAGAHCEARGGPCGHRRARARLRRGEYATFVSRTARYRDRIASPRRAVLRNL